MSTKPGKIKHEITVGIYLIYPAATLHVHASNFFPRAILHLLQVRSMHAGNQSKGVDRLFGFHLN